MAAPSLVYTIALVAEMLGEDEDPLAVLAMDLDPEHDRLRIYDTDDRSTLAFTAEGVDNLRELIRDQRR